MDPLQRPRSLPPRDPGRRAALGGLVGLAAALAAVPRPAAAAADRYLLETDRSEVQFRYTLEGVPGTGTMPIVSADLRLDFDRAANSSANVVLDASRARTGVIFVTQALKSGDVLNTAAHPRIVFRSRSFAARSGGASVAGDVTIRGVTRPLTLAAAIFRQEGTAEGDLSRLTVQLTGHVSRSAFGAGGFADLVADRVDLQITARLRRAA